jgi:hypothetical protein
MTNIDMTLVIEKAAELNNDLVEVNKALKRVASVKCRLKAAAGKPTFNDDMTRCLQEEQLLKHVKGFLTEPRKTVNNLTAEDIEALNYDEVCKAIRSIQSKKTHTKWAEDCKKDEDGMFIPGSGDAYKEACRIEAMLLERKHELKPVGTTGFSKAALRDLLDELRLCSGIEASTVLDRITAFLEGGES